MTSVFISEAEESAGMACRLSAPQPRRVLDTAESSEVYPTFVPGVSPLSMLKSRVELFVQTRCPVFIVFTRPTHRLSREAGESKGRYVITQITLNHV